MSSNEDARRQQPLADETTRNVRAPARSGVVERVEPAEEGAPAKAPKPDLSIGKVTEIAPPPSPDPRRD